MLAIGSDHAGYALKCEVKKFLDELGVEYIDCGCDGERADYPDIAEKTCAKITSGECDPVGGKNHKLVDKLDLLYRSYGLPVTYQLWEGARHEILNETNKDEIINWILDYIGFFIK